MPYHIRKKVLDRVYSVLMYVFLFCALFPIFWMIYTSFMSNNEIIQGKISYQRAPYNVIFSKIMGSNLLIGSSDGAINIYDLNKKSLAQRKAFKTAQTNFKFSENYIWLSSADRGLIRINPKKLSDNKRAKVVWSEVPLDFNKISKTLLATDEKNNRLWLSVSYKDYGKIFEYDTKTLKQVAVHSVGDAFPYSFEKLAISDIFYTDNYLYIATNLGIAKFNTVDQKVEKIIEHEDFSIAEVKSAVYDSQAKQIYFSSIQKVYTYSPSKDQFKQIYTSLSEKGMVQLGTISLAGQNIALATGHGFILINRAGKFVSEESAPLFNDIDEKGRLLKTGGLVNSDVTSIEYDGANMILGTSGGRVSIYNLANKQVEKTVLIDKKSFVKIHWRNYIDLFHNIDFALFLKNSFLICGITALISMLLATITAYALVRFPFPGNRLISTTILSTQMIPGVMTLIPIYITFMKISQLTGIPIKGTYAGMIFVYAAFFLPFSIWILRGFFASIPIALEEAATIDGCSPFQVFWKIALPLSVPGIVATGIYIFLVAWDELVFAWVLSNAQTMTIPVGIRLFVGNFQNRYDLLMAASTVATIPVLVLFAVLQRHIVSGLTAGAVKQ